MKIKIIEPSLIDKGSLAKLRYEILFWTTPILVAVSILLAHVIYLGFWLEVISVSIVTLFIVFRSVTSRVEQRHDSKKITFRSLLMVSMAASRILWLLLNNHFPKNQMNPWVWSVSVLLILIGMVALALFHFKEVKKDSKSNKELYYSILSILIFTIGFVVMCTFMYLYFKTWYVLFPVCILRILTMIAARDSNVENFVKFILGDKAWIFVFIPIAVWVVSVLLQLFTK